MFNILFVDTVADVDMFYLTCLDNDDFELHVYDKYANKISYVSNKLKAIYPRCQVTVFDLDDDKNLFFIFNHKKLSLPNMELVDI